jgi:Fe-S-cluster containining protein
MKFYGKKRCTGHCCRGFTLPYGPQEMRERYDTFVTNYEVYQERFRNQKPVAVSLRIGEDRVFKPWPFDLCPNSKVWIPDSEFSLDASLNEIYLLYPMLIYLGEFNHTVFPESYADGYSSHFYDCDGNKILRHSYACKHLSPNRDCSIYEIRPAMCSLYPYGSACRFAACKCSEYREPLWRRFIGVVQFWMTTIRSWKRLCDVLRARRVLRQWGK